jgi:hypothetical protein
LAHLIRFSTCCFLIKNGFGYVTLTHVTVEVRVFSQQFANILATIPPVRFERLFGLMGIAHGDKRSAQQENGLLFTQNSPVSGWARGSE